MVIKLMRIKLMRIKLMRIKLMRIALMRTALRQGFAAVAVLGLLACTSIRLDPEGSSNGNAGNAGGSGGATKMEPPSLGFFSRIKVPTGVEPSLRLAARGAQVFRCEVRNGKRQWVFRQPDAELHEVGQPTGPLQARHGVNYSFEHIDGSRLLSQIVSHDNAPASAALPWLLLTAKSYGNGAFAGVTHVQRVNTAGGLPPASCDLAQVDQVLRVDFSAEFVFYRPSSPSS